MQKKGNMAGAETNPAEAIIHVHGALVHNYQLVKVLPSSSSSAAADLAHLATAENIDLCGSQRAENILKNNVRFKDDAVVKLYYCQMGFSLSLQSK